MSYADASDAQRVDDLWAVNKQVNEVPYVPDSPIFGEAPDTWKFVPDNKGFLCRDYTVAKADALVKTGWPAAVLSVVLCYDELGEYHAVLWAEVGGETWVLDNRATDIYLWDEPPYPYKWSLRQVAGTDEFKAIA